MTAPHVDAQIDWACITSVLSLLECGDLNTAGPVVRKAALTATVALLTERELKLAPPPQKPGVATGVFDHIREDLALRLHQFEILESLKDTAIAETGEWVTSSSARMSTDFDAMLRDDGFKQWLEQEVRTIWIPHSIARDGLFDLKQKELISATTGLTLAELERLHPISRDVDKLQQCQTNRAGVQEFEHLSRAYAGAFIVRSTYYDSIARHSTRKIAHHQLRTSYDSFLPDVALPFAKERTEKAHLWYYLAGLILAAAQKEKQSQRARIAAYSKYVNDAIMLSAQNYIRLPLREDVGQAAIESWLYETARQIPVHTTSEQTRAIIRAVLKLGPGLLLLCFSKFTAVVLGATLKVAETKADLEEWAVGLPDTKKRIINLVKGLPPGRFDLTWDRYDVPPEKPS